MHIVFIISTAGFVEGEYTWSKINLSYKFTLLLRLGLSFLMYKMGILPSICVCVCLLAHAHVYILLHCVKKYSNHIISVT